MKSYTLKKWESTLDLCVHAHGYDVELIMKTSCKNDYPLGINLSYVYDLSFCLRVLPLWYLKDIVPLHYLL